MIRNHRKKLIIFIFLFSIIGVITFAETRDNDNDESFYQRFKAYFLASQPSQNITQETYQKPAKGHVVTVPIIVYHSVRPSFVGQTAQMKRYTTEPTVFEQELAYLKTKGYHTITLAELRVYFESGKPLPKKPVILTFDDGWENQYTYAFPLLKKYGFTGTFFIWTDAVGHKHFMTWDEIKEMDAAGMTIGGHTKDHPKLTQITDPLKLTDEIAGGKKVLEDHLGKPVDDFAYPFGLNNTTVIKAVQDAGYLTARTSSPGIYHSADDLLHLSAVYDQNNALAFKVFEKVFGD